MVSMKVEITAKDMERLERKIDLVLCCSPGRVWLPIVDACHYAGLSKNTLMACIKAGDIKAKKRPIGGWIVDRRSIDAYNQGEDEAAAEDVARRLGL